METKADVIGRLTGEFNVALANWWSGVEDADFSNEAQALTEYETQLVPTMRAMLECHDEFKEESRSGSFLSRFDVPEPTPA